MKLNILFLPSDNSGVYLYRVFNVSKWLSKLDLANTRILYQENYGICDLLWADVIVCQRKHDSKEFEGVVNWSREQAKLMGIKKVFIYDTDDYLEEVPENNPTSSYYFKGSPIIEMYQKWIRESDYLSTSTQKLSDFYKDLNKNRFVMPNFIDPELWEMKIEFAKSEKMKKEVRIGFAGSMTHYDDLKMVKPYLVNILNKYKNVKLVIFGVPNDKVVKGTTDPRNLFDDIDKNRIEYEGLIETRNYPTVLKHLQLDIGICPLVKNDFNQAKSAIKFYEYSMAGVATVASMVGEYPEVITSERGYCVKNSEWVKSLSELIEDETKRKDIVRKAKKYVETEKVASKVVREWYKNYEKAYAV